ncbi:MAG: 4-(cytidine 5'-diphospho)-2-C-methyl-D-erythritol kinase [Planctomycetes bacterium RBG_16_55_9]|nr:MAG: 4-(cytidine 5'-diphospho)-2-C-methyl-D-erythritol kinase [Planctomycetes bacterium RBG_16_55_9]
MEQISLRKDALSILAPAKINLCLLVAGRRPDGFHELETVMAKINWYDEILIQPGHGAGIELTCEGPCWAPAGEENIVHRAAKLLLETCHSDADIRITLRKNIPAGTGLGSASSDAAATLLGLNRYLHLNLEQKSLFALAAQLGSDVSFFLNGPLALCTGKGEKVRKLDENFKFLALLIVPDISVSTKKVYEHYTHNSVLYKRLSAQLKLYIEQKKIDLVVKMCTNMLQESCFNLEKSLAELRETVESLGVGPCCLSGSGSSMFCFIESGDERQAIRCKRRIKQQTGCETVIVRNNHW